MAAQLPEGARFDPITGAPLGVARFDPITGAPLVQPPVQIHLKREHANTPWGMVFHPPAHAQNVGAPPGSVFVRAVTPGSPAAASGVHPGAQVIPCNWVHVVLRRLLVWLLFKTARVLAQKWSASCSTLKASSDLPPHTPPSPAQVNSVLQ